MCPSVHSRSRMAAGVVAVPQRSRRWVFTLNNWTEEEQEELRAWDTVKYIMWGREVGANGTPHLQGLFIGPAMRLHEIKGRGGPFARMHLEIMRGSFHSAATYCKKDGDWEEVGDPPSQGKRTDLDDALEAALEGVSIREALISRRVRSWQGVRGYMSLLDAVRAPPPTWRRLHAMWLYGATGCGKTVAANSILESGAGTEPVYRLPATFEKFWMGYSGESRVVLDDVGEIVEERLQALHQILGGGPCNVRVSGGARACRVTHIIITSHYAPQHIWQSAGISHRWPEFARRLNYGVWHLKGKFAWVEPPAEADQDPAVKHSALCAKLQGDFHAVPPPPLPPPAPISAMGEAGSENPTLEAPEEG